MKIKIDYSKYSYEELIDAATHIDSNAYPERMAQINFELDKHKQDLHEELASTPPPKDFNDDFAKQIDWTPLEDKSSSYKTHHLHQVSDSRIEYKASISMKFNSSISVLTGFALTFISSSSEQPKFFLIVGILTICAGLYWFLFGAKPMAFDKAEGVFLKGREQIKKFNDNRMKAKPVKLDQIHAIQLISEYITGQSGFNNSDDVRFHSYEINLVLINGERVNVIDHGDGFQVLSDAEKLSSFLEVPVWNGIQDS